MKSALFTILAGALCASMTASAADAKAVRVTLKAKGNSTKIEKLPMPQGVAFPGAGMSAQPVVPWQVVNIPVEIEAPTKAAQFVPQLTFTAHLLIESDSNDDKPVLISKEITYVDIPLSPGGEGATTTMSVGIFIPPSSATRINTKGKGDLKGKLLGVAIEATFNDKQCMKTGESRSAIFDNTIKKKLSTEWWKKNMGDAGAVACSIDETPYAAWAGSFYPAVLPAKNSGSNTGVTTTPTTTETPESTPTEPPADTTETTPTDSADSDDTATEDSGSNKKRGRNKKRNRR